MSSETQQVQPDTSISEPFPYSYQPQPPSYYPLRHDQEGLSGSSGSSFIIKRQSVLKCRGPSDGSSRRNLYRWTKWCSDGSAALAQTEDRSIHVLEVPQDGQDGMYLDKIERQTGDQEIATPESGQLAEETFGWSPSLVSRQPTPIISAAWYPSAAFSNPSTYCFALGTRDRPVRLIDAHDGRNRGTYPILHNEQFLAPTCMTFSNDASRLYAGHDTAIDVFDIAQPGEGTRLKLSPSRKSKDGQKGIVSAIAFSPDTSSGLFAVGTFKGGRISCYSEDTGDDRVMELDLGSAGQRVEGQGITQLAFHPLNPYVIFSASRQSDYISVYDVRNPAYGPYLCLHRPGMTQQRLGFDIDWAGRYLTTGDSNGILRVYDINPPVSDKPVMEYNLHSDAIGSVSSHPFKPWILTAYGSRQPSTFERSLEESSESEIEFDSGIDSNSLGESSNSTRGNPFHSGDADPESELDLASAALAAGAGESHRPANLDESAIRASDGAFAGATNRSPTLQRKPLPDWIGAIEVTAFS